MIKLEPLLISAGLRLAICLSPLSTLQPCICLGETIAEEWKPGWTWGKRETCDVTAAIIYQALYPETENKQHEDIKNIEVHPNASSKCQVSVQESLTYPFISDRHRQHE